MTLGWGSHWGKSAFLKTDRGYGGLGVDVAHDPSENSNGFDPSPINMATPTSDWSRLPVLLAINLLFLMVWGFAGFGKFEDGYPGWFEEVFGKTVLGRFPGTRAAYWGIAVLEVLGAMLALGALVRLEFLGRRSPDWLLATGVLSLFVFIVLGFGEWLTKDFAGAFQLFLYFAASLLAVREVREGSPGRSA